jgi:tetratricopeptide (TPR) repeat protein
MYRYDPMNETTQPTRLQLLEQMLAQDPGNDLLQADVYQLALDSGDHARAQAVVEAALAANPSSVDWRFKLASICITQRRLEEAGALLLALDADLPGNAAILHNRAFVLFLQGKYGACADMLRARVSAPSKEANISALQALWLRALHHLGQLEQAWAWVEDQEEAVGNNGELAGIASLIAVDIGRFDIAQVMALQVLQANARQFEALLAGASVALVHHEAAAAHRLLDVALEVQPNDPRAWSTRAFAQMLESNWAGARKTFETTLEIAPDHADSWRGLAWNCLLQQDLDAAERAFHQALALAPDLANAAGGLAVVEARRNAIDNSLSWIAKAKALDSEDLAAKFAESLLSGEVTDLQQAQRLAERWRIR